MRARVQRRHAYPARIRARTAALLLCTTLFALYTAQAHAPALWLLIRLNALAGGAPLPAHIPRAPDRVRLRATHACPPRAVRPRKNAQKAAHCTRVPVYVQMAFTALGAQAAWASGAPVLYAAVATWVLCA